MTGRLWALCTCGHYRVEHPGDGRCSWRSDCPCKRFKEKHDD